MRSAAAYEAEKSESVVHFERGDYCAPEFGLPPHVHEAAERALRDRFVGYDPGPGSAVLREAIAAEVTVRGRRTDPNEVVVTAGAKHALSMVLLALLQTNDEIVVPDPGYPPNETWGRFSGARIVSLPLQPGSWQVDLDRFENVLTQKTKVVVFNSPQRPNGELLENLDDLVSILRRHPHVWVVSDEIFSRLVFDGRRHVSLGDFEDFRQRTVLIDSFSKTYAMTGYRVGWLVAPQRFASLIGIMLQEMITNVPTFCQQAALAALTGPQAWVAERVSLLQKKRDRLVAGLRDARIACPSPPATFYAFVDVRDGRQRSSTIARDLLYRAGVAVVPGTAFGSMGEGFLRLTFAVSKDALEEGLSRLKRALPTMLAAGVDSRPVDPILDSAGKTA
jgi:aspartate/methionine/tyrosine aminotransferase